MRLIFLLRASSVVKSDVCQFFCLYYYDFLKKTCDYFCTHKRSTKAAHDTFKKKLHRQLQVNDQAFTQEDVDKRLLIFFSFIMILHLKMTMILFFFEQNYLLNTAD